MTNEGAIATPYDVFLSYSNDTRQSFTANLYHTLRDKGIKTFFLDDDDHEDESEDDKLRRRVNALEESRISIVVLSKDYASSMRCLDELVKIIDCKKRRGQQVWPIFYGVDPSDVRYERGSYGQAMVAHEDMINKDYMKVQEWRTSLSEVANLNGWQLKIGQQQEYEVIQKIVEILTERPPSYDVFISFIGKDTRYSFTGFLHNALDKEGFKTFMNDEGLEDGDQITQSIIKAIEGSKFLIIVLSENYAYSSLSLDQLVRILDSRKKKNQLVWPIFYKVEPTEVRHQKNSYCKAMKAHESSLKVQKWRLALKQVADIIGWPLKTRHQKNSYCEAMKAHEYRLGEGSKKVEEWRSALKQVANFKGWYLKTRYEYKFIQEIIAIMKLPPAHWSYDVFVSFRGIDARQSFVGHLYYALELREIKTFMYDGELKIGDQMAHSLKEALEESRISIVVLSKDYASSRWCLDELVQILDCRKKKDQLVLPIFYGVDPSDVRRQRGTYARAMEAHENTFGAEKVKEWRSALTEVADISAWFFEIGNEHEFVQRIVDFLSTDVFISFTGGDTRYSFTGFLYNALCQKGFKTFMDDEGLRGGDELSPTLMKAIGQSRLSVIVFSENYAYSSWCLDELVMIIECMKSKNQQVLPIFYKIEKSDLCNPEKSYGKAMAEHDNMFRNEPEKVQKWRTALSDAANSNEGMQIEENEYEYEFIKKIVERVGARLSTDR